MNVEEDNILINKSYNNRLIHVLTQLYDCSFIIISLMCMILDIWIIVELFLLNEFIYGMVSAIFVGLSHLIMLCAEVIIHYDELHYECSIAAFCLVGICFTYLIPSGHFILHKIRKHLKDEDEDKYPQWKWLDDRREYHAGHFLQHSSQTGSQLIIHIAFIIHHQNQLQPSNIGMILKISVLISMSALSLALFIKLAAHLHSTFTTVIFVWFCVVTDMFGILLIIFYVFSNNDSLFRLGNQQNNYLNIFAEIWMFNYFIFTVPITLISIIIFFFLAFSQDIDKFNIINQINETTDNPVLSICCAFFVILFMAIIGYIFAQFCTCVVLAIFVEYMLLSRFKYNDSEDSKHSLAIKQSIVCSVESLLDFITEKKDEEMIRLICVNYAIYELSSDNNQYIMRQSINALNTLKEEGKLHDVEYADLRTFVSETNKSNLIKQCWQKYIIRLSDYKLQIKLEMQSGDRCYAAMHCMQLVIGTFFLFFFVPLWCVGKIITFLYGWIFLVIIVTFDGLCTCTVSSFQLILLTMYLVLQCMVFVSLYFLYRQQYILWHVGCGVNKIDVASVTPHQFMKRMRANYKEIEWLPAVKAALIHKFGPDVGYLIFKYTTTMIIAQSYQEKRKRNGVSNKIIHSSGVSYQYGSLFVD